jgi:hypothetical protein
MRQRPETKLIVGFYGTLGDQEPLTYLTAALAGSTKNFRLGLGLGQFIMYHVDRLSPSRHLRKGKIVNPEVAPVFT